MATLCSLQDIRDRLRIPLSTACSGDASRIEHLSDLPERTRARLLGLTDDWEHIGRVAIRLGLHGAHGGLAGLLEPWVSEGHPTSLGGRKGLTGARGDERLLLSEGLNDFAGSPSFKTLVLAEPTYFHLGTCDDR